jgi:pSer/pThr/pTyr-binding forkhead associated (FHA) protein
MQRLILEVQWGSLHGIKQVLDPGGVLRVGRRAPAHFVIGDEQMSAPHFEIQWDGTTGLVRDLSSQLGTTVDGEKVAQSALENGSWIRAGSTDFMVYLEAATPPPYDFEEELLNADEEDLRPEPLIWLRQNRDKLTTKAKARNERANAALARLRAEEEHLYAVLDAARGDRILTLLKESVDEYRSLYEGTEGEALADVAPYLVRFSPSSELISRVIIEGWEKRWGSFIVCPRSFKELRQHLRRFLIVADEDTREQFYFRYYDPVVLRSMMETATPRQTNDFFGPISAFVVEGEFGEITRFTRPEYTGDA